MSALEIGLYITPCLIEVFLQYLEFRRVHTLSSTVALMAFALFTLGLLCLAGVTCYKEERILPLLWIVVRVCLGTGSILWITSQILWFRHRVTIVDNPGQVASLPKSKSVLD